MTKAPASVVVLYASDYGFSDRLSQVRVCATACQRQCLRLAAACLVLPALLDLCLKPSCHVPCPAHCPLALCRPWPAASPRLAWLWRWQTCCRWTRRCGGGQGRAVDMQHQQQGTALDGHLDLD